MVVKSQRVPSGLFKNCVAVSKESETITEVVRLICPVARVCPLVFFFYLNLPHKLKIFLFVAQIQAKKKARGQTIVRGEN